MNFLGSVGVFLFTFVMLECALSMFNAVEVYYFLSSNNSSVFDFAGLIRVKDEYARCN